MQKQVKYPFRVYELNLKKPPKDVFIKCFKGKNGEYNEDFLKFCTHLNITFEDRGDHVLLILPDEILTEGSRTQYTVANNSFIRIDGLEDDVEPFLEVYTEQDIKDTYISDFIFNKK